MDYSGEVKCGQATCVCGDTTVFEGAVIGQLFTGPAQMASTAADQRRASKPAKRKRKSTWRRPKYFRDITMERATEYRGNRFTVETIRTAIGSFREVVTETGENIRIESLKVGLEDGQWKFDDEGEFFAALPHGTGYAVYLDAPSTCLQVTQYPSNANVLVQATSRARVQRIFSAFDAKRAVETVPVESPVVFIGHGRSPAWKDLRDHLRDQHDYRIECYESGSRSGHSIRDILESMAEKSSFALLVMTGEDEQASGALRARQNVIHEAGIFQGRLGFSRAIILREEGVESFSNIDGIQYIEFAKDRIRETYGDVLATLRREFGAR